MRRTIWLSVCSLLFVAGSANAQGGFPGSQYGPSSRPAYSPYLNLTRRDAPLVTNYYGLVRPEVNFRNALQQLDSQQAQTNSQQAALESALAYPATGHPSRFLSHNGYFLTNSSGGGGGQFAAPAGGAQGTAGAAQAPPARGTRH